MTENRSGTLIVTIMILGVSLILALTVIYGGNRAPSEKINRIVLITIDTLRADHLVAYGYPRQASPFIDSLADKGVIFTQAYSAAPHTAPSHASIFTSLFPFEHNLLRNQETLNSEIFNLPAYLTSSGFEVSAFPAVKFLEGKVGFPQTTVESDKAGDDFGRFWYRNAETVVDRALSWIHDKGDKKSFLWVHFYDVHQWKGNKNIPPQYLERIKELDNTGYIDYLTREHNTPVSFFKDEAGTMKAMNGYDARLLFVDEQIKRLYDAISEQGLNRGTLWIITSDHGEGLGNHNYEGHGEFLYQEQLHVPLIFHFSNNKQSGRRIRELVRTVDLFPTIAELIGHPIDREKHKIEGISLLPLLAKGNWADKKVEYSFAERRPKDLVSFRRNWEDGNVYSLHNLNSKYIEHTEGVDEFYNLESDRFESKNIAGGSSNEETELKSRLAEIFKPVDPKSSDPKLEPVSRPEEVDELKSLGYL